MNYFFFKKKPTTFFPPEGAQSSCQGTTGGLPFAAAAFLHGAGRTPSSSWLTPRKPNPSPDLISHACCLHLHHASRAAAGQWKAPPLVQHPTNIHIHLKLQPHGISYFTVTDWTLGIHCHPENDFVTSSQIQIAYIFTVKMYLCFLNIVYHGISTWRWNPIYSNMEAAKTQISELF